MSLTLAASSGCVQKMWNFLKQRRGAWPITIRHKEIYVGKSVGTPRKYGWGWLLWLGLFFVCIKDISFSDITWYFIAGVIPLVSLIAYFALRLRFLRKWRFPQSKPWIAGLAAGVIIYPLSIALFSIVFSADGMLLKKKIESVHAKYQARVAAFKQDETKYGAKFINRPKTAGHIKQNVKTIDRILAHDKDKRRLFHEMFDDYRQALKGKSSKTGKQPLDQLIDDILSSYDASYEKRHKSWTLLRTYYVTGKNKYYQSCTNARQDATQSAIEVQERIREAFGMAPVTIE